MFYYHRIPCDVWCTKYILLKTELRISVKHNNDHFRCIRSWWTTKYKSSVAFQVPGVAQVLPAAAEPRRQQDWCGAVQERDRSVLRVAPLRRLRRPLAPPPLRQLPRTTAGHRARTRRQDQASTVERLTLDIKQEGNVLLEPAAAMLHKLILVMFLYS